MRRSPKSLRWPRPQWATGSDMNAYRKVARLCFSFSAFVALLVVVARATSGRPLFAPYDLITWASVLIFGLSMIFSHAVFQALQILILLAIGAATTLDDNVLFGMALFSLAFLMAIDFGYFDRARKTKVLFCYIALFFFLTIVPKPTEQNQLAASFMWTTFVLVYITILRFIFEGHIQKARAFDQAEISRRKQEERRLIEISQEAIGIGKDLLSQQAKKEETRG